MALQTDPVAIETVVSSWEAYAACMDAAKFAPDLVSDLALPGHAFRPRESCGMYRLIGCLDPHHKPKIQKIKWSCHSRNCRVCWRNWAEQRARVISDRLVAGVVHLKGPHVEAPRERRILHVVVSVPPDSRDLFLSTAGRKDLRRQARQRLARVVDGFDGGAIVDHAYRFTRGLGSAKFSPHFHFLVAGWFNPKDNAAIYKKEKGYFVKLISSLETKLDLYACTRYLLSHSSGSLGDVGDRSKTEHAVRYFGEFSYNKFRTESILTENVSAKDDLAGLLSSLTTSDEPIKSIDVAEMEVPFRYQDSKKLDSITTDTNGIISYLQDKIAIRQSSDLELDQDVQQHKDYPAKPKSTAVCMACGLEVEGDSADRCRAAGHTLYEMGEPRGGYDPPEQGGLQDDKAPPPPTRQLHIRLNHTNKSRIIVLILDGSLDRICDECYHVYKVVHYTGPPNPELFESLPDGVVTVPQDMRHMFVYWDEWVQENAVTVLDNGKVVYHPVGVPYFTYAGRWETDWGAYQYPDVEFTRSPQLQGAACRHVFYSILKARALQHDQDFTRTLFWDYCEHCRLSTMEGGLREKDKDGYGFAAPMDLLADYKQAAGLGVGHGTRPPEAQIRTPVTVRSLHVGPPAPGQSTL